MSDSRSIVIGGLWAPPGAEPADYGWRHPPTGLRVVASPDGGRVLVVYPDGGAEEFGRAVYDSQSPEVLAPLRSCPTHRVGDWNLPLPAGTLYPLFETLDVWRFVPDRGNALEVSGCLDRDYRIRGFEPGVAPPDEELIGLIELLMPQSARDLRGWLGGSRPLDPKGRPFEPGIAPGPRFAREFTAAHDRCMRKYLRGGGGFLRRRCLESGHVDAGRALEVLSSFSAELPGDPEPRDPRHVMRFVEVGEKLDRRVGVEVTNSSGHLGEVWNCRWLGWPDTSNFKKLYELAHE